MKQEQIDAMAGAVVDVLQAAIAPLKLKIEAQEQEIAALKSTAYLRDAGTWKHGATYAAGDVAQFSGSPWVCTKAHTASGPTADHACWRLWVKSGKR